MFVSNGSTAPVDRAQRLLHGMHQVCSHDLPNQSVALESLLHLFAMDEAEQLSPQALEYLQRLQSVAHKISGMAQFLRDLIRLDRHQPDFGEIAFERFVSDVKSELNRQLPEHAFTWNTQFAAPAAVADRRLLLPAVIALVHGAAEVLAATDLHLKMKSAAEPGGAVTLHLSIAPPRDLATSTASPRASVPTASAPANIDRRLEFALGFEFLALANIVCRREEAPGAIVFVLTFPT